MDDSSSLQGRVVLVTGAAGGLGSALVRDLSQHGAIVVGGDVDGERLEGMRAEFSSHPNVVLSHLDVTRAESIDDTVASVLARFDRLDVLINNAGIDVTRPVDELTVEEWDRIVAVNLRGPFLLSRSVLPVMRRQGSGHIVNTISTAALRAWPNASAYHATKWGLLGLTYALHTEARAHGIGVTALICGGMRTPFLLDRFPDIDVEALQEPASVAQAVRFVLMQPPGTVIPELMVLPTRETSWP